MAIATNKDYLLKALAKFSISEDDVDLILAESPELDGNSPLNLRSAKLAIYKSMSSIIPLANINQGGYSITWNMEAVKIWYNALCKELKKESVLAVKPKIRNKSNVW